MQYVGGDNHDHIYSLDGMAYSGSDKEDLLKPFIFHAVTRTKYGDPQSRPEMSYCRELISLMKTSPTSGRKF